MALKALHHRFVDLPNYNNASSYSSTFSRGGGGEAEVERGKLAVIGHRGNGMNTLLSEYTTHDVKENTILSFNTAANYPLDFIEFDVQVTKDGCPIIYHDNFIFSEDRGEIHEKRVTNLSLSEFLSYGPQKQPKTTEGKTLLRKRKDGRIVTWNVESDDPFCTLQETFEKVNPSVGFNIELKFDESLVYAQDYLTRALEATLQVVSSHAKQRPIIFSSFQPDAALLIKQLQTTYPVFFLTNGGNEIYRDVRRNSLEEAFKLCLEGGLQGLVCEVRSIFRNPGAVNKTKELKLSLLTYGRLNNVPEAVYMQHLMGIDGVIVDFVPEITKAVSKMVKASEGEGRVGVDGGKPKFSERELAFLLKLIPELIQQ